MKGLLVLILFVLCVVAPPRVQASDNKFCYAWNSLSACYDSKPEAYEALLAVLPATYRNVIRERTARPIGTYTSTLGDDWQFVFEIPDQPPKQIFDPAYNVNGWGGSEGICASANDPLYPNFCSDGDAAAQATNKSVINNTKGC